MSQEKEINYFHKNQSQKNIRRIAEDFIDPQYCIFGFIMVQPSVPSNNSNIVKIDLSTAGYLLGGEQNYYEREGSNIQAILNQQSKIQQSLNNIKKKPVLKPDADRSEGNSYFNVEHFAGARNGNAIDLSRSQNATEHISSYGLKTDYYQEDLRAKSPQQKLRLYTQNDNKLYNSVNVQVSSPLSDRTNIYNMLKRNFLENRVDQTLQEDSRIAQPNGKNYAHTSAASNVMTNTVSIDIPKSVKHEPELQNYHAASRKPEN